MSGRWGVAICAIACLACTHAFAGTANAATATERVTDGGFDQTLCNSAGCLGSVWQSGGSTDGANGVVVGPICSGANFKCASGPSGYHNGPNWARLGRAEETGTNPAQVDSWIQQDIQVPASFPPAPLATLHVVMRVLQGSSADANLTISLGGTTVLTVGGNDPRFTGSYAPVDVPLDAYVGPGARPLRFEAEGFYQSYSTSFDIDDISVMAPDALAGPTGQRAAALAKCKKKHGKKRKKCKQRANLLPV